MLKIRSLRASAGGKSILKGIDLDVKAGEVHAIMGPNGSGKSTLANVLAGRESVEVTEGEVLYEGRNLLEMSPEHELVRRPRRDRAARLPLAAGLAEDLPGGCGVAADPVREALGDQ